MARLSPHFLEKLQVIRVSRFNGTGCSRIWYGMYDLNLAISEEIIFKIILIWKNKTRHGLYDSMISNAGGHFLKCEFYFIIRWYIKIYKKKLSVAALVHTDEYFTSLPLFSAAAAAVMIICNLWTFFPYQKVKVIWSEASSLKASNFLP